MAVLDANKVTNSYGFSRIALFFANPTVPTAKTTPEESPSRSLEGRLIVGGKFFRLAGTGEARFLKAVTYGPFPASRSMEEHQADFLRIRTELGANVLRLYEIPQRELIDAIAEAGLRVFLGPPWNFDVDFLEERRHLRAAHQQIGETVSSLRGHPAVAGYFIGNEIQSTLVRWMGPARVRRQLERLIETGKKADPDALFSYANYPSTEYLLPRNQDFVSFNVYLEQREDFGGYLRRLQNLAGNKPLMMAEFGLDSQAHGEQGQADALAWKIEESCRAGAAGTTVFSWSDQWWRTGESVEDWDFGLVRRDGSKKAAFGQLAELWKNLDRPADGLGTGAKTSRVSVIICTYGGSRNLRQCLQSVENLRYEDYEIILVNDGSDTEVSEIAYGFPKVRLIETEHAGLSAARNRGAAESTGEILAYTDDDCEVDPDWLTWLVSELRDGGEEIAAVGGPNVPPVPESFWQACVEASPGGPAHVLISDREAEHIPGCNLAVRRAAFDAIGGFDERFWTAGDDVDFCWRLRAFGFRIGFHPAAMVWHYRRFTIRAYLCQQIGYGKAEAQLVPVHPERFGVIGGARWEGGVYDAVQAPVPDAFTRIYQGVFGYAPFQFLYGAGGSSLGYVVGSFQWSVLALIGMALGVWLPLAGVIGAAMLAMTIGHAWRMARRAIIDPRFDGFGARLWVGLMALMQPIVRSFYRFSGSLPYARLRRGLPIRVTPVYFPRLPRMRWRRRFRFWSEAGVDRDGWLKVLLRRCTEEKLPVSVGSGWETWDVEWALSNWWSLHLTTVTQYHGAVNRLNKARLEARPTMLTTAFRTVIAGLWILSGYAGIFEWLSWASLVAAVLFLAPGLLRLRLMGRIAKVLRQSAEEVDLVEAARQR